MLWPLFYGAVSAWMLRDSFWYFYSERQGVGWLFLVSSAVNAAVCLTYIF